MLKLAANDTKNTEFVFHIIKKNYRDMKKNALKDSRLKSRD